MRKIDDQRCMYICCITIGTSYDDVNSMMMKVYSKVILTVSEGGGQMVTSVAWGRMTKVRGYSYYCMSKCCRRDGKFPSPMGVIGSDEENGWKRRAHWVERCIYFSPHVKVGNQGGREMNAAESGQ